MAGLTTHGDPPRGLARSPLNLHACREKKAKWHGSGESTIFSGFRTLRLCNDMVVGFRKLPKGSLQRGGPTKHQGKSRWTKTFLRTFRRTPWDFRKPVECHRILHWRSQPGETPSVSLGIQKDATKTHRGLFMNFKRFSGEACPNESPDVPGIVRDVTEILTQKLP